jgi:predicted metal-dependent hydrolase
MNSRLRRELIGRLTRDARAIAGHFGLEYRSIEAERANVKSRYGICYEDGSIKIRLTHAVSGQPLKYSSLVSTLCHELAHLRHFDHGPRFKLLYQQMLEWSRAQGIYRPRPVSRTTPALAPAVAPAERSRMERRLPRQLELFG